MAVDYLNPVELIIINEELVGAELSQLRNVDLLESAILRPQSSAFGQDAYPTIIDKAAALFHSLCNNHTFVDGNKRVATVATIIFLNNNGYQVSWTKEEAYEFIMGISKGEHDVPAIAAWLQAHTTAKL